MNTPFVRLNAFASIIVLAGCLHAQGGAGGQGGFSGTGGIQSPITPKLQVLTTSLASTTVGASYSQTVSAAFGIGTLTFSETGALPSGLSLNTSTGVISGTVGNNAGIYNFVVTVTDQSTPTPQTATQNLSISVLCTPIQLTSPAIWPVADQGTAYNFTVPVSGGIAPLTFAATNLPTGESINTSTGAVTGTPSVNGTFSNIGITVTDSCPTTTQSVSGTFTEQVNSSIAITTPPTLQPATTGVAYSTQLAAAGGTLPYTNWAITAGSLPAGLGINPSTGNILGTPIGVGTSTFTVTVTDSAAATASLQMTITVSCTPLTIATLTLPNGTQNQFYNSQEQSTGGFGNVSWSGTLFPSGLTISSAGLVSGTTASFGAFTPDIIATDSCPVPQTAKVDPSLTIAQQVGTLQITTPSPLPDEIVGQAVNFNMAASGGVPQYTWANPSGAFPPGVSMNAAGAITGTPTQSGSFTPNISVTDTQPVTAGPSPFSITVTCPAESITTTSLPPAVNGTFYSFTPQGTGGFGTVTWGASGLPTGLTINSSTGNISGTPSVSGTSSVTLTRTDSCAPTPTAVSVALPLQVNNPPLAITTNNLPSGTINQVYSTTLSATGGTAPYTWAINAGSLQTGLTLTGATGVIGGTPTVASTVTLTIQVTDNAAHTATVTLSLTINPAVTNGGADNRYCNPNGTWSGPATDGPASAPKTCVYTPLSATPSPGTTVTVTAGSCTSLQNAINGAVAGETIIVPALSGAAQDVINCTIKPAAAGNATNWITLRTDLLSSLPGEGNRVTPAWFGMPSLIARPGFAQPATAGVYGPKIIGTGNFTIQFQPTAAFWRIIGLEVTTPSTANVSQIVQGSTGWNHIIFDRVVVHGGNSPTGQARTDAQSGIALNECQYCAVIDSYIFDTHCGNTCTQSQGIGMGGNGTVQTGPLKIVDNYIESAGENLFSGGGGAPPPAVIIPSTDVEVRHNHTFKPLFWKQNDPSYFGTHFEVDNDMELKNSQRIWIEGNIFDQNWGYQGSQQGNAIIFGPRNQSSPFSGSASSNGSGTLTWISGTKFNSNLTSANCGAAPGHCLITYNGVNYEVATFISTTKITVQAYQTGPSAPPAISSAGYTAYNPGLNPNAVNNDVVFRYNYITHSARIGAVAMVGSNGNDLPLSLQRVSMHDNVADDINGFKWTITAGGCCVWSTGWQIQSGDKTHIVDTLTINHTTNIEFLTGSSPGLGPGFGFGQPTQTLAHQTIINNISAGGFGNTASAESLWKSWVTASQLCFERNFFAIATNPLGPNGAGNFKTDNNPPYPTPADNAGCSFTATGNVQLTDFNAFQFTNLNNGVGGNYQLLNTSPGHNAASDGTDIGANIPLLNTYIAGVQ